MLDYQADFKHLRNYFVSRFIGLYVKYRKYVTHSNDLDSKELTPNKWLHTYKNEQQNTERGFKFIKDPVFMLDKIFLKLPRRIMALTMVIAFPIESGQVVFACLYFGAI